MSVDVFVFRRVKEDKDRGPPGDRYKSAEGVNYRIFKIE